jgi:hypothetical protein
MLVLAVAGVFGGASATSAASDPVYNFSDASKAIVCQAYGVGIKRTLINRGGGVECDDLSTFGGPQDYPRSALVPVIGKAFLYRSDNAGDPIDAQRNPIAAGHVWQRGYLRCTSRTGSMTCVSLATGHGFFLSARSQRAW